MSDKTNPYWGLQSFLGQVPHHYQQQQCIANNAMLQRQYANQLANYQNVYSAITPDKLVQAKKYASDVRKRKPEMQIKKRISVTTDEVIHA